MGLASGASAPAWGSESEPSRRDRSDGSDPKRGGTGYVTNGATNPVTNPRPACRSSGKKGGVAPVLPRAARAARAGLVVSDKSKRYNNIGKLVVSQINDDMCHKPPSEFVTSFLTPAVTPALTPEGLITEAPTLRFIGPNPAPSSGRRPTFGSRQSWVRQCCLPWEGSSNNLTALRLPATRRTSL